MLHVYHNYLTINIIVNRKVYCALLRFSSYKYLAKNRKTEQEMTNKLLLARYIKQYQMYSANKNPAHSDMVSMVYNAS